MKYKLADDARPQAKLLLIAAGLTIALWFIPYAEYLVYPIRLFVTFIHESSHALIAILTGGSVASLTIASDGSGVVYSAPSGFFGAILTSSAGYLGTTVFGVLMLFLIRRAVSPNKILFGSGIFVGLMTLVFAIISPIFHILSLNVPLSSVAFTVLAGVLLTGALLALAKYASVGVATFATAFLTAQCLLNALSDLKTVLFMSAPLIGSDISTDAGNMATATGIPSFLWVIVWIAISLVVITVGLRMYTAVKSVSPDDSIFEDQA
jgi:Peptidase M50B-like